ncbi:MAG TPA: type II toxin-antitoxin system VapC family toxin, partial [Roseateles sp.]|nr:type II toxin-antitoxin system VapC family toxin [Roseateles sp.]
GRAGKWGEALMAEYAEVIGLFKVQTHALDDSIAAQVRFAIRHHVQGYDALYLALAMQTSAKLATMDGGLRTAARSAGVELF